VAGRRDQDRIDEAAAAAVGDDADGRGQGPATYSISALAREFGVTLRTLRFYEDKGLIHPRREGSTRIYTRRDRARLRLVLMGKRVGFSLAEIHDMLDLYDLRDGQVPQMRVAVDRFNEQIALLERQKRDIEQAIDDLKRTISVVTGLLRERQGGDT